MIMIMIARFSYNLPILSPGHNLSRSLGHSAQHQQQRFHPRNLNVSQVKIRSQDSIEDILHLYSKSLVVAAAEELRASQKMVLAPRSPKHGHVSPSQNFLTFESWSQYMIIDHPKNLFSIVE